MVKKNENSEFAENNNTNHNITLNYFIKREYSEYLINLKKVIDKKEIYVIMKSQKQIRVLKTEKSTRSFQLNISKKLKVLYNESSV